jgi:hypothetical protein
MASDLLAFPPPQCMQADEYSAADPARRRLTPKSGLRIFASLTNLRQRSKSTTSRKSAAANDSVHVSESTDEPPPLRPSTGTGDTIINLDGSAISDFHESKDVYRWAILYENQRGHVLHLVVGNQITYAFIQLHCILYSILFWPLPSAS